MPRPSRETSAARQVRRAGVGFAIALVSWLTGMFGISVPSAIAGDVSRDDTLQSLVFIEGANEANNLTITLGFDASLGFNAYTVADSGAPLRVLGGCTSRDTNTAVCPAAGVQRIFVDAGSNDDAVSIDAPTPSFIQGGVGNDTLSGGSGPDEILGDGVVGGSGNDTITGNGGADQLTGDGFLLGSGNPGSNTIEGGDGNDTLLGGDGDDSLSGDAGIDKLLGRGGNDMLFGGAGEDVLSGGDGDDRQYGQDDNDTIGLAGSSGILPVPSELGNDLEDGGTGDDTLRGGPGPAGASDDDDLKGGDGHDVATYDDRTDPVVLTLDGVPNDGAVGEHDNVALDVEKVVGGSGDDRIIGGPGDDTLDGAAGADVVEGLGGNDTLFGGDSDGSSDTLRGGPGNDALAGGAGDDLLNGEDGDDALDGGEGTDTLDCGGGDDRALGGPGPDKLSGGAGNDDLQGGDGDDMLDGGAGNDSLKGQGGNDLLRGGTGADELSGGDGKDVGDYELTARVTVTLDDLANDGSAGERDNVRTDVENVEGGGDQDTFFGSAGSNTLDGAFGEDYLDGARGNDDLRGGGARDVVRARDGSRDVVDCGRSVDFAIVDPGDKVKGNCERKSDGAHDRAKRGAAVLLNRVKGTNQFGIPGMSRTVPLQDRIEIPVRSRIDSSKGRVNLTSEANAGQRQTADFYGGEFRVEQQPGEALTSIRLQGGGSCAETGTVRPSRRPHKAGLWGDTKKSGKRSAQSSARHSARASAGPTDRFRTVGASSSATVAPASGGETLWFTQDRCDGTLTRVVKGAVEVRDFRRDTTISLSAGESYLARATG